MTSPLATPYEKPFAFALAPGAPIRPVAQTAIVVSRARLIRFLGVHGAQPNIASVDDRAWQGDVRSRPGRRRAAGRRRGGGRSDRAGARARRPRAARARGRADHPRRNCRLAARVGSARLQARPQRRLRAAGGHRPLARDLRDEPRRRRRLGRAHRGLSRRDRGCRRAPRGRPGHARGGDLPRERRAPGRDRGTDPRIRLRAGADHPLDRDRAARDVGRPRAQHRAHQGDLALGLPGRDRPPAGRARCRSTSASTPTRRSTAPRVTSRSPASASATRSSRSSPTTWESATWRPSCAPTRAPTTRCRSPSWSRPRPSPTRGSTSTPGRTPIARRGRC